MHGGVRGGDASYLIYLLQVVTLPVTAPLLVHLGLVPLCPDAVALIIVAATVALGILVYDFIEKPLVDLTRAAIPAPSTAAA